MALNVFVAANRFYSTQYHSHPLITLALTNASLAALSDILAQAITILRLNNFKEQGPLMTREMDLFLPPTHETFISTNPSGEAGTTTTTIAFDIARLARFSGYGFMFAPVIHNWFSFLEKRFPMPQETMNIDVKGGISAGGMSRVQMMRTVCKRTVVDQLAFAPIGLAVFFSVIGLLEGNGIQGIKEKFSEAYIPALKANYAIWPLVQLINFRFLPLRYRVPFVSSIGVLWTMYLSLLNSETTE
ncbi:hypothetical protein G9A89_021164 [Geosiphon pyriformis]|nr:hypothetical protein G9A89_021164 [Geosiphon pyriformis]